MSSLIVGEDGVARPLWAASDPLLRHYYDTEWGLPIYDEQGLFERITLEAFQSGLSWATILRKRPAFRVAFAGFEPDSVAAFTDTDVERLLVDAGIVRNRAKILATIKNANATVALRSDVGLVNLIWSFMPGPAKELGADDPIITQSVESLALSKALKKRGFTFVGPTTMYALMEAIGMVNARPL